MSVGAGKYRSSHFAFSVTIVGNRAQISSVQPTPRIRPMRTDPDRALVTACQEEPSTGFQGAFRQLYEQYRDRVYNVCYRITGNGTDALDASQETFGILFRKIGEFRFE